MKLLILILVLLTVEPLLAEKMFQATTTITPEEVATLKIAIIGPFSLMYRERIKKKYPATLVFNQINYPIDLELRGKFRLKKEVCSRPPMKLRFKKDTLVDTIFEKQDSIKLVVQCNKNKKFRDYLRKEYLSYKALNILTESSYQVRWINIRYQDSISKVDIESEPAFFIERKKHLAKRLKLKRSKKASIKVQELDTQQAALISLFQYFIANADYSLRRGPELSECCHNAKLLEGEEAGESQTYIPVIYDFDSSGIVNASYAQVPQNLNIKKVTQRIYRGYCAHNETVTTIRPAFIAKIKLIQALFENDPILSKAARKQAIAFIKKSQALLSNDKLFKRRILDKCLG